MWALGVILTAADISAQLCFNRQEPWEQSRTVGMGLFGALYYGGPCMLLYTVYDKVLGPKAVVAKALCDVFIHTPFCVIPSFYALTGAVKGQSAAEISTRLKADWMTASFGSVCFWLPTQIITFKYVPRHSRIAWVSSVMFVEKAWLSWIANRGHGTSSVTCDDIIDSTSPGTAAISTPPVPGSSG